GLSPSQPIPDALRIPLPELHEELFPTYALSDPKPKDAARPWLLLIKVLPVGTDLDKETTGDSAAWTASPTRRFERLLRETGVPIGLVTAGTSLRLVYAPRGESAGTLTYSSLWLQDNTPAFGYVVSGSWEGVSASSFDNIWTNITYVYESDPYTSKFYVNGIYNANLIGIGPIYPNTVDTQLILNARTTSTSSGDPLPDTASGSGINGNYQNVLIYNRALTSSEVAQLVPEPSALSLLAVGLGVLFRRSRKRDKGARLR
ncbi:MAG: PEP-CTERM sorting domain-containing protein, partial [Bacteroidetes bacterium]|nr:PEP-CTERM sorting domain-containing protein [Bacteroidota bacterium]